jgi:hypothetical protein
MRRLLDFHRAPVRMDGSRLGPDFGSGSSWGKERFFVTRMRIVLLLCAVFALMVGVATATAGGGNSANAKKCQNGGWQTLVRSDGTSFTSEGACVSYAARGGTLTTPTTKTKSQLDCEALGGTFATGTLPVLWTCNGWTANDPAAFDSGGNLLVIDCFDGNPLGVFREAWTPADGSFPRTVDATCFNLATT